MPSTGLLAWKPKALEQRREALDEEVEVLEESQDAEVRHHADDEERLAPRCLGQSVQPRQYQHVAADQDGCRQRNPEFGEALRQRAEDRGEIARQQARGQLVVAQVAGQEDRGPR